MSDDISLEQGLDLLASAGMDVKVVDEEGVKDYIILEPICIYCEKPILKPADCDMELFRYGLYLHLEDCLEAWSDPKDVEPIR